MTTSPTTPPTASPRVPTPPAPRFVSWTASTPEDDVDVVTIAAMRERLGVQVELHDAGLDVGELNVIASPLQTMRDVFDLMATDTDDDWSVISRRFVPGTRPRGGLRRRRCGPPCARSIRPRSGRWARGIEQAGQIQQLFIDMVADAATGNDTLHAELARTGVGGRRRVQQARRRAA